MRKGMRIALTVAMIVSLAVLGVTAGQAGPKPKKVELNMGSTSSTSGMFAWSVAMARVINKYCPNINNTVIESGATIDNLRRMREGVFDWACSTSWNGSYQMYKGISTFKGDPWPEVRLFCCRSITNTKMYVRKDSGIKKFSDLSGKKFCAGFPGSGTERTAKAIIEVTGVPVKIWPGSLSDAKKAIRDGRISGIAKAGPPNSFDAGMMELHATTPMNIIGLTKEQAEKVTAKYPYYMFVLYPKGTLKELPDVGGFYEQSSPSGASATSSLPQEIGYQMIKAVYEHWDTVTLAFPACADVDPIEAYSKLPKELIVPFHAGVVQYAKEKGLFMPEYIIPPEYKAP